MPYEDSDRLAKFYGDVFGWKMNKTGEEMGNYVVAHTTETDDKQMVKTPGAINGGFYPKMKDQAMNTPSVVVSVNDIQAAMKKITDCGGKVLGEPMDIPGVGKYVSFIDTEGNRASILQPKAM